MKEYLFVFRSVIFVGLLVFCFCSRTIDLDASRLASLYQQKTEMIKLLLQASDTAMTTRYMERLAYIDAKYRRLQDFCAKKYSDSLQKAQFDKSYQQAYLEQQKNIHSQNH